MNLPVLDAIGMFAKNVINIITDYQIYNNNLIQINVIQEIYTSQRDLVNKDCFSKINVK